MRLGLSHQAVHIFKLTLYFLESVFQEENILPTNLITVLEKLHCIIHSTFPGFHSCGVHVAP